VSLLVVHSCTRAPPTLPCPSCHLSVLITEIYIYIYSEYGDTQWTWADIEVVLPEVTNHHRGATLATGQKRPTEANLPDTYHRNGRYREDPKTMNIRLEASGQRAWSLDVIKWLLANGAEPERYPEKKVTQQVWHLHPLYLSCYGTSNQ
jgi:hypothetical protein